MKPKRSRESDFDFDQYSKRARLSAPELVERVDDYQKLDFFRHYVEQMCKKHLGSSAGVHPYVRDFAWPPIILEQELNMKFVKSFLMQRVAGADVAMQMMLQGASWAPDQPFCFKEVLPHFLDGLAAHRAKQWRTLLDGETNSHFEKLEKVLQKRYVRGIDPALIRSGQRKGTVYGMGDLGIYNAEHRTSIMPGKTHPECLRWKLEHWPCWLEGAVLKQFESWPSAGDPAAIRSMLSAKYSRELPHGVNTEIKIGKCGKRAKMRSILRMFGGEEAYALSVLSQALLFRDVIDPKDKHLKSLRVRHGLGAGTFTIRGFWLAYHRLATFESIDTETFCPAFVGALAGAIAIGLPGFTGVDLAGGGKNISWDRWETQVRFASWTYALQKYMKSSEQDPGLRRLLKRSGFKSPLHATELEAHLCFLSRLATMYRHSPESQKWRNAAKAIGGNLEPSMVRELFTMRRLSACAALGRGTA